MESTAMNVQLPEEGRPLTPGSNSPALRFFGHLFSFLLHPLFIPSYLAAFLIFKHPYAFAALALQQKEYWFAAILFSTVFLPAFSIFLMKKLGFVESIYLRTQRDRIIPYIVCMIYYFWIWYVSRNLHQSPEMVAMLLATFIASIAGMMANIYFKISMHGIAAGMLLVFFIWLALGDAVYLGNYLVAAVFITGLICTARFIVSDHSPFELYAGLLAGALCQLVAIAIAG
jgi:hypothetical protein